MDDRRAERISETIREELGEIVAYEMADPRIGLVTISEVKVGPDLRHAHVRVALSGDSAEQEQALAALDRARGYLRHVLATRLDLYRVPELHFEPDLAPKLAAKLGRLRKRIRQGRPRDAESPRESPQGEKNSLE